MVKIRTILAAVVALTLAGCAATSTNNRHATTIAYRKAITEIERLARTPIWTSVMISPVATAWARQQPSVLDRRVFAAMILTYVQALARARVYNALGGIGPFARELASTVPGLAAYLASRAGRQLLHRWTASSAFNRTLGRQSGCFWAVSAALDAHLTAPTC